MHTHYSILYTTRNIIFLLQASPLAETHLLLDYLGYSSRYSTARVELKRELLIARELRALDSRGLSLELEYSHTRVVPLASLYSRGSRVLLTLEPMRFYLQARAARGSLAPGQGRCALRRLCRCLLFIRDKCCRLCSYTRRTLWTRKTCAALVVPGLALLIRRA